MARKRIARGWYIALLVAICAGLVPLRAPVYAYTPITPITTTNPSPAVQEAVTNAPASAPAASSKFSGQKLIVDNSSRDAEKVRAAGAVEVENYGAFSLWALEADAPEFNTISKLQGVTVRSDFDTIYLRDNRINTASDKASNIAANLKANLRQNKADGAQLWLVQFAGPMREAWLKALEADGIKTVIYMPSNAYVIWATGSQIASLENMVSSGANRVQWTGAYHPQYRIDPALVSAKGVPQKSANDTVGVTVQFYNHAGVADSLKRLRALGGKVLMGEENILDFKNFALEIPFSQVENLATWPDVFNIELWSEPVKNDEVQNQIIAGNVISSGGNIVPTAPGYLAWLGTKGFVNDPSRYPIVDVVDDGVDNGTTTPLHPDFYLSGLTTNPSRLVNVDNCTAASSGNGVDGHGNLNAGIIGSYNAKVGSPHVDAQGYNRGLGVNPFGRIASTKIFGPDFDLSACGGGSNYAGIVAKSFAKNAKISSNSWGANTAGAYAVSSQAYDTLQRDASATTPGNQELLHIFSAGNRGPGATTVGSPGTAKNVIAVAATENVRDEGIPDGCDTAASNNADDMSDFSSRGPTTDGRIKPDISAPGVHIQGPASQDPAYNGSGVCGGATNFDPPATKDPSHKYYPNPSQNAISQTLYTWSSGTSHSAPAVAGGMSLVYEYYTRTMRPGFYPSPAMAKALIVNTPRYLNGLNTGGNLPSPSQGWGDLNLGAIFDGTPRYLNDQEALLTGTGQQYTRVGTVVSNTKPVHVTLVWQDAPGSTTGNSYVNNLDLEVTVGGNTYKGNVFSGKNSVTGGTADVRNNTENVFIPAGVSGPVSVRVIATNIAGNGVPGNASALDQDFALIIYNAQIQPQAVLGQQIVSVTGGDNDGFAEPGETLSIVGAVTNFGDATANNVTGTLTTPNPGVTIVDGSTTFGNIAPSQSVTNTADPYIIQISPAFGCAGVITLVHTINYTGGTPQSITVTLPVGAPTAPNITSFNSTDTPLAIPDGSANPPITSTINTTGAGTAGKITVRVNITHAYDADVDFYLIAPNGTRVELSTDNGGGNANYVNTVFDDDAGTSITAAAAPFTGSYRPEGSLATVAGANKAGAWKLEVDDDATPDAGTLNNWTINFVQAIPNNCADNSAVAAGYTVIATSDGDNVIESSETVSMGIGVKNQGSNAINGVVGTLSTSTPGVTIINGTTNYGTIAANGIVTNTGSPAPYTFSVNAGFECGKQITFTHVVSFTGGATYTETIVLDTGTFVDVATPLVNRISVDVPKTVITATPNTITSTLNVTETGKVGKLRVRITNFTHTYVSDITMRLQAPDGTTVVLINQRGGTGDNFINLVFDDAASTSIVTGTAPFTGSFRPEEPLSIFRGKSVTGTWRLIAADGFNQDGGTLSNWSIDFGNGGYVCVAGPNSPLSVEVVSGNNQFTPPSTTFTNPLVVRVKNSNNMPVSGAPVVYSAPTTGASGTFAVSNQPNLMGTSDANGLITSTLFTANAITGTYNVTVTVGGGNTALFTLTNGNAPPCNALLVSSSNDDGTGASCGTLSYALLNATSSSTITVSAAITLTGPLTPTVPTGVKIVGGTGDCSSARVVINGNGVAGDGLQLSGSNELVNLHVKGFSGRQIVTLGTGNKITCSIASRS